MPKFKFPIDDTKDEVDDELEYYTDDSWQDFDPDEEDDDMDYGAVNEWDEEE